MSTEEEIWKDIPNFEGLYQVSTLGRVKSLGRVITTSNSVEKFIKEKIRKLFKNVYGYESVNLNKEGSSNTKTVHRLVMLAFNGESDLYVDHINGDKTDNRLLNLRYCTQRENLHYYFESLEERDSKYVGVTWCNLNSKWKTSININKKYHHLGFYDIEKDASEAFNKAVLDWETKGIIPNYINPEKTSKHKGIHWCKSKNKWVAQLPTNYASNRYVGAFESEEEALIALNKKLNE